ncbi:MAG: GIY-YIG nuclease family protein [Methylococcaceae bacterium]|nr:GIY-YIG nuclease family protein [Methylococcaceae bacterium]
MSAPANWSVYIIQCSDFSLYTGITIDIVRRYKQHANQRGAKYFRARQPLAFVYLELGHNRKTAGQREAAIKKLRRSEKLELIASASAVTDALIMTFE